MNLLAIDTSTSSTVLGLLKEDAVIDCSVQDVKTHSREILPAIASMLTDSGMPLEQLDAIVFGQGPGSFTGLRIAVGVVQGMAYGANLPVVPVSSMAVLAHGVEHEGPVFVAVSARLEEIYFGSYQCSGDSVVAIDDEGVLDVSDLGEVKNGAWHLITDVPELQPKIESSLGITFLSDSGDTVPAVSSLIVLGQQAYDQGLTVSALDAAPVYLREQVASR